MKIYGLVLRLIIFDGNKIKPTQYATSRYRKLIYILHISMSLHKPGTSYSVHFITKIPFYLHNMLFYNIS